MITIMTVKVNAKNCLSLRAELPESPPLILMVAEKGFVMCGFLNIEAAEKAGVAGAMVSGVKSFEDVLNAQIRAATTKAKSLGVQVGMTGKEALMHMF